MTMVWSVANALNKTELARLLNDGWEPFAAYPFHNTILNQVETVYVLRKQVDIGGVT